MKYLKILPLALIATLTSQNAIAIGAGAYQAATNATEQARKDAEARLAEADAAQKALVKKAAEEEAAAAKKAAEEEAARKASADTEAIVLTAAGIEVNDSNKGAVKLLLDLEVSTTFITAGNIKSILEETSDIKKKAVALGFVREILLRSILTELSYFLRITRSEGIPEINNVGNDDSFIVL